MARPERFELPTPWFVARYSIQLSYGRAVPDWRAILGTQTFSAEFAILKVNSAVVQQRGDPGLSAAASPVDFALGGKPVIPHVPWGKAPLLSLVIGKYADLPVAVAWTEVIVERSVSRP